MAETKYLGQTGLRHLIDKVKSETINNKEVYIGTEEPTDANIKVWIDPNGKSESSTDLSTLLDKVYPIGSIYISVNSVNPTELFGGTWEQIKDTFLLACSDTHNNGETGGATEMTLTSSHLPSHTHSFSATSGNQSANHTHDLNSHTHSIPALSGTAAESSHTHLVTSKTTTYGSGVQDAWRCLSWLGSNADYYQNVWTNNGSPDGSHGHSVTTNASTTGASTGSTGSNSGDHTHEVSGITESTGSGSSFSILPPYLAVHMWKRTA